ncbi:MAG: hypothetical protein EXS18_08130 [Verrucomicrobiae bacterium]|nr:hypothetical protein [Verrucomicrobiae bacterium]
MNVQRLLVAEYQSDGWGCQERWIVDPEWHQVERAIRELDRFMRPYLWFYTDDENASDDELPDLEIMGGKGAYAIEWFRNGTKLRYIDQSQGKEIIVIWESDQGAEIAARNVCFDVETVVSATKYFCEHGVLDPGLSLVEAGW